MAEIVGSYLGPTIEVVKYVAAPIIRQFNYLCCFSSIITSLRDEAKKLEDAKVGLEMQVTAAKNNVEVIVPQVETWLKNSEDIKENTNMILDEVPNVQSGCLSLRARFSLSKRAKMISKDMKELRKECKFTTVSHPTTVATVTPIPSRATYVFESRRQIEQDIMTTLVDGNVNMIGICGMGGVGKTTMAKRIMKRASDEHLFDEVVMVVVSQTVDELKIQLQIAEPLGLQFKEETFFARAKKLRERLMGPSRTLLVLDDVWKSLALEDLGVPCESGCTVLLTSRNRDVLSAMNVKNVFALQILSEGEDWFLFTTKAGPCVDDSRLNHIAEMVVDECKGLPIALATVGAALKDERNSSIWEDALQQLRKANPIDIPNVISQVYKPLKLSYDFLDSRNAKSIFLLCCLFGEDDNIPIDYLTFFSMGLRIFEDIGNLEEARNRMFALVKILKSHSLLLDSHDDDHVKMHDVVRDVCMFIAKQEGFVHGGCGTWTFSFRLERIDLLLIRNLAKEEFKTGITSSAEIRELYVLYVEDNLSASLPHNTRALKNLTTLIFDSCWYLETIHVVGELVNLEILVCRGCHLIKELPLGIKRLNHLKLLELSECEQLQSIGRGIISSLVGLEELKILRSFHKWEAEDRDGGIQRANAGLKELEFLTNLRCLEIEIEDATLLAEEMHLSSKMVKFDITIPTLPYPSPSPKRFSKKLHLRWPKGTCLGHWVRMQLLASTEYLYLTGQGAKYLEMNKPQNRRASRFEDLYMWESGSLRRNRHDISLFANLSSLHISRCRSLCNLGPLSMAAEDYLSQLESLNINACQMMEQVFLWKEEDETRPRNQPSTKIFPKLKTVVLTYLPNLTTFCQGIKGVKFPLLMKMQIYECPRIKSIVSTAFGSDMEGLGLGGASNVHANDGDFFHLFCQPDKVSFGSLKELAIQWNGNIRNAFCRHKIPISSFNGVEELKISWYRGNMSLFSSSIARNLVNLKRLRICDCDEMIQVIKDDEEEEKALLFPKLQELRLMYLRKLVTFCEWKCDIELPSLKELRIERCPNMQSFTLGFLATPNLKSLLINYKSFGAARDLNGALHQYFAREEKYEIREEDEVVSRKKRSDFYLPSDTYEGRGRLIIW